MMRPAFVLCCLIGGSAMAAPTIAPVALYGAAPPAMAPAIAARALAAHNRERGRMGEPPLVWDEALAKGALDWAQELARSGQFEHASAQRRKKAGENLFMGTAGAYPIEAMIEQFIAERDDFLPGTFPAVTRDGNWHNVAHYTQIVWRRTQKVGCAMARGRRDDVLVCRYWPAGNIFGQKVP
ncbi:CAP domain-containing protein [Novosphingobium sp. KACC 22771]|uniref:CAP domain-containing protein n=1 Tax=Novosphingobium sp. KACC 22771 TaxID=3025670 RepID=UPI0023652E1F|nr:CAP domain-containing protein [Novosphingobium sp. KACC 22771]WDF71602.1 CAP domain-containing protein [Novosphingobium sp. KACC 22771]